MARDENPPFGRGETWYNGATPDSADLTGSDAVIGREWVFEDRDPTSLTLRSNRPVRVRAVRNVSGAARSAKRAVTFSTTAGLYGNSIDGYATTTAQECYPLDEYISSSTGLIDDDVGYIVIEGPAMCMVGLTAGATTNFAVGDWLVSQTAATSQAATAGYAEQILLTGATAPLANQVMNRIGRALTAKTTANTGADVLVDVGHW